MAGYGADLDETPRWRLSVLFMVIVVLSLVGHIGLHSLEEYFRKQKRKGLKHTLQSLKDELFALGLITLLLITLQDQLVKICVPGGDDKYGGYDKYSDYPQPPDYPKGNRKLLAGTGGDFECASGKESLWSITVLHEIHILIFIIAVVHLVQAAFSMVIAELRVRRWKKYEDAPNHDMVPLKRKGGIKAKGSWVALWAQAFFMQFIDSVDRPIYLAIRRLFIEKMELDDNFNFHNFVVDSMEEDFAKLVEFQWIMWLIAAIYILIPWQAWSVIWLPCVFLLAMLIVGAKLQAVAIQLASLAYTHYTPHFIAYEDRSQRSNFLKRSSRSLNNILALYNSTKDQDKQPSPKEEDIEIQKAPQTTASQPPKLNTISVIEPKQTKRTKPEKQLSFELGDQPESTSPKPQAKSDKKGKVQRRSSSHVAEYLSQAKLLKDSSSFFWFGKPKLMARLFQYVYFQSGLIIALLILDEWRGQQINHLSGHAVYVIMIGVNLLVLLHASLFVIPSYGITVAAGAYNPDNLFKKAIKRNVNPKLAKKLDLERKSMASTYDSCDQESVDMSIADDQSMHGHMHEQEIHEAEEHDDEYGHGHGHGHDDGGSHIKALLQAMDNSQARKKKLEEQDAKEAVEGSGGYYQSLGKQEPIVAQEPQTVAIPIRYSIDVRNNEQN
eukprot:TRINITY_DN700_c0_g1_i11.p1 TRINITY_DN700_c0_g1~~TRINITY_DN700_c0_g1_i11.p1  ORF type:complete len:666 (-),score=84.88 TRINITY_DN700_c0_g1_i11:920-2917(-)